MMVAHWNGCLQFLIASLDTERDAATGLVTVAADTWIVRAGLIDKPSDEQWAWCFYHAMTQLLAISTGMVQPERQPEMWIYLISLLAGASLYAIEVKVDEAVAEFKRLVGGLADGSEAGGGANLGLADFADVFDAVPPGVDELVALAKVVALARADSYGVHFDRVIVDTAPTGHTLRLLTFPEFLDRFIERLLLLRSRFNTAAGVVGGASAILGKVFGGASTAAPTAAEADEPRAVAALVSFQQQMRDLQSLLTDGDASEFVIVSIPTYLSLTESERLYNALCEQRIRVRRGVLNRLLSPDDGDVYLDQLRKGQQKCLGELRELASRSLVSVTEVPYFDAEVRAVYGLRAMGTALFEAPVASAPDP